MGDIKRRKKKFSRPKKPYDKDRIEAENELIKKYGLKNKREIWRAKSEISKIRIRAKNLIAKSDEEKAVFFNKLNKIGFKTKDISDVLALTEEDFLKRRLQTFIFMKNLCSSPKQARQLITHKHVLIDGKAVNSPSRIVYKEEEDKISLKPQKKKKPAKSEEIKAEETEKIKKENQGDK
jgi:small subunit ribosomal protein S4